MPPKERPPKASNDNESVLTPEKKNEIIEGLERELSSDVQELQGNTEKLEQLPWAERDDWSEGPFSKSLFEAKEKLAKALMTPLLGSIGAMAASALIENPATQNITFGAGGTAFLATAGVMGIGEGIFKLRSFVAKMQKKSHEKFA